MKSIGNNRLSKISWKFIYYISDYVPKFIGTKKLTFLSLIASFLVFISYFLAKENRIYFISASGFIFLQWVFDCLDGHIGRSRKEGFVRWGYYMDHLFDYLFLASIVFGFYMIWPDKQFIILFLITSAFMVSSFLYHDATKDIDKNFHVAIYTISPVEMRLMVIIFNVLFFIDTNLFYRLIIDNLLYFNLLLIFLLMLLIYKNQKKLHKYDIRSKQ